MSKKKKRFYQMVKLEVIDFHRKEFIDDVQVLLPHQIF